MTKACEPADTAMDGCGPPQHLRGADTMHYVQCRNRDPEISRWIPDYADTPEGGFWWHGRRDVSPRMMADWGYRYICAVPSPAELAALVRAARAAKQWQERRVSGQVATFHSTIDDLVLADLNTALQPFEGVADV